MTFVEIDLLLPPDLAQKAQGIAARRNSTLGQVIRDALHRELRNVELHSELLRLEAGQTESAAVSGEAKKSAPSSVPPVEAASPSPDSLPKTRGAMRDLLAPVFQQATSWDDLQDRCKALGIKLVFVGPGISLRDLDDRHLFNIGQVAQGYAALVKKFGGRIAGDTGGGRPGTGRSGKKARPATKRPRKASA